MTDEREKQPVPPWLYKLFTGHQYPYVRRQAKFANRDIKPGEERPEPTKQEIDAKFWEIYPRCSAKILQEVKSGMIVTFVELGEYGPGSYQALVDKPEEFLAERYGKKKIKLIFMTGIISSARRISKSAAGRNMNTARHKL